MPEPHVLMFDDGSEVKGYRRRDMNQYAIEAVRLDRLNRMSRLRKIYQMIRRPSSHICQIEN